MSTNYSEQIFQSIDTIVSQRLNEVSFDKTEICEIISIDEKTIGKYLVSNGSLKYEAYSDDENRKYLVGSKVYVRINNGDYSLRKVITGSYTADEIPKNLYTNPFDNLVVSSKYNWITEANKLNAIAKRDGAREQNSYIANGLTFYYSGLGQFNYIGLEFAATTGFGGTTGEFQIIIDLLNNNGNSLLTTEQLGFLTLSSKQLYGNPYYLNGNLKFQHLFKFPIGNFNDLTKVKKIKITLVTQGDFNYLGEEQSVIINDLTIFFGFDSSQNEMSENKVTLVLDNTQSLEYTTTNDKKQMSIDWRDLNSGAIYNETPNMQYPEAGKYNIYWLQYSESIGYAKNLEANGGIDIEESGTYWKTVKRTDAANADAYTYTLSPSLDWKKEQIKVMIRKVGTNNYIESKGLTFTNTEFRTETGSNKGKADTLRLTLAEGDDGIYNSYGIDNKLLTSYNLTHTLTVDYVDNNKWDWNPSIQKVIWKIPAKATMIKHPGDNWRLENNFYIHDSDPDLKTINFNLSEQFSYNKTNNTIYCEIIRYKYPDSTEIENDEYQGSITLQFGLQGTAGTGWAFNITSDVRSLSNDGTMILTASLENSEGEPIPDQSWVNKVTWSWYQSQFGNSDNYRYKISNTTGKTTRITYNGHDDYYAIIKATLTGWLDKNGNSINLEEYYPIAKGNPNYYLTGASRVTYNNTGSSPNYDEEAYCLYNESNNHNIVNSNFKYTIVSSITEDEESRRENINKIFSINSQEGNLRPLSLLPSQIPKMALQVKDPNNHYPSYIQPILVLRNGYQSKLLNEWDGNLKVDPENNKILSALIGAGVKNSDNTFTGVLMGAVGKEISTAVTGIYGYQSGDLRFKLDEKGNFYVGTGSDNRIDFSGTDTGDKTLIIEAKNFKLKVGSDLYFSNTAEASDKPYWLRFQDKIYFHTNGNVTIGGWNIIKNEIYSNTKRKVDGVEYPFRTFMQNASTGINAFGIYYTKKVDGKDKDIYPFRITHEGKLYATGADIQGKININSESILNGTNVNQIKSATITSTPDSIALKAFEQKTTINGVEKTLQAHLQLNADNINAKVSKVNNGITETMSWNLTSGSFTVKANGTQVMKVTKDGLTITGNGTFSGDISAATGTFKGGLYINATNYWNYSTLGTKIAGWTIDSNSIKNGNTTLSSSSGSYGISTSSIEITGGKLTVGSGFKVNSSGTCEISNSAGFISMGISNSNNTSYHPYVSGLNVATGGIAFRNVEKINDNLKLYTSSLTINSSGYNGVITSYHNLNINGGTNMALDSNGYLRIDANNTSRGTKSDPWSSWTASDSLYLTAGGNINIRSMGDIYLAPYGRDLCIGDLKTENNKTTFQYYTGLTDYVPNVGWFIHGIYIGKTNTPI